MTWLQQGGLKSGPTNLIRKSCTSDQFFGLTLIILLVFFSFFYFQINPNFGILEQKPSKSGLQYETQSNSVKILLCPRILANICFKFLKNLEIIASIRHTCHVLGSHLETFLSQSALEEKRQNGFFLQRFLSFQHRPVKIC